MGENQGVINSLNDKGFGFIKVEGRRSNVFFHAKQLVDISFEDLREGDTLGWESITKSEKGESANGVYLIEK